ncbi:MAG: hypothetical protein WCC92_21985 [Candidatus Korobacteraceae bacterium]
MALSKDERARIREEELVRFEMRKEMKRKHAPVLLLWAAGWILTLTVLALTNPQILHH